MSSTLIIALGLAITAVVPLLAIYWVANRRSVNRAQLLVKTVAAGVVILTLYVASVWPFASYYLRYLFPILYVVAVAFAWREARQQEWTRPVGVRMWLSVAAGVLIIAAFAFLLEDAAGAGSVPDGTVEVNFPFQEGTFYVVHGGSKPGMNAHMGVRDRPRFRGQTWALDIVQLDRLGRRALGVYPRDLARYRIFGTPVVAPCHGMVTSAENTLPDLPPPEADDVNLPGNYVQIECEAGFFVLLAHLGQGSVRVGEGDAVATGEVLGTIGNSGNTSEPHLHIHAQAGTGEEYPFLDADPIPIVFRGHGWLKRNDVVRVRR